MVILKYLWERRTTVLGYIQIILSVWVLADVFSSQTVKIFVLMNGTVTAILGHYNNSRVKALVAATAEQQEEQT